MDRSTLRNEARRRFTAAWERERPRHHGGVTSRACPALAVLPDVLDMIDKLPGRRISELQPVIHRMLVEAAFIDECGDPVATPGGGQLHTQARVLVEVLDEVYAEQEATQPLGNVSHMFG